MTINIRHEETSDYRVVEEIAREAFWNLYFPGCHEHFVVHKMRTHPDFIKELSFVIEVDGVIAGAIFYTHSKIISGNGETYNTITFGPVFISPQYHRMGLGRQLISHSIEMAKVRGYRAIVTLGYPFHYSPYGFRGGKAFGITLEDGNYYVGLLVLPLYEGALADISGVAIFSDVFDVTDQDVELYDSSFAVKEKGYQSSQDEYAEASMMIDET